MSLTIDRIRELCKGRALPGSLACIQGDCTPDKTYDKRDHCSCRAILAELGIATETPSPLQKKVAERVAAVEDAE